MRINDYGQGSESDDAQIYHRAWIYRKENQELQNLDNNENEGDMHSDVINP
ncbi:unnamed protein product [marine sediment metagenome]|uniref:Uncharacterized protein n=1 Tax=marine sediment metagenome TaxID=412755 RepID=X1B5F7_9ZZZZ